jgi:hypothetical protein
VRTRRSEYRWLVLTSATASRRRVGHPPIHYPVRAAAGDTQARGLLVTPRGTFPVGDRHALRCQFKSLESAMQTTMRRSVKA